jgi:hypothetical protein
LTGKNLVLAAVVAASQVPFSQEQVLAGRRHLGFWGFQHEGVAMYFEVLHLEEFDWQ